MYSEGVCKAYELTIGHIGQDKDSGDIWKDYIQLLHSSVLLTLEDKTRALRKAYYCAVKIPFEGVEQLWQELELFENSLDRVMAKKVMASLWPHHKQACLTLRQLVNHLTGLWPELAPTPLGLPELILPALPTFAPPECMVVARWKAYLRWEESRECLKWEHSGPEKGRLVFALHTQIWSAYSKALIHMWYHPDIWFGAYTWLNSIGEHDDAFMVLKQGIEANPSRCTDFDLPLENAQATSHTAIYSLTCTPKACNLIKPSTNFGGLEGWRG